MPFITMIISFFTSIGANIKAYSIIAAVILGLTLLGYVWYKLSSDESTIATLNENNKTLQTSVSTLQKTTAALQTDIKNVQAATAQANATIQSIQTASAKKAQVIQSTDYNAEASANSENLTNAVNTDLANEFNSIQQHSVITAPSEGTKQ